jgi:oligopeptide/dipeptide ABC transporter ATP-binding protein
LDVRDLHVHFAAQGRRPVKAVDGVSFTVGRGETLGIVGESGCGKSVTALSILGLLARPPAQIGGGQILLEGRNLLRLSEAEMEDIRGNEISMIFQEPMTSLNPVLTVGDQIAESFTAHRGLPRAAARIQAIEMLRLVKIPDAERRSGEYPHQLSGGMRQRVMIAMALACRPKVLIADEPTTALDVTIQAQILALMRELQAAMGMAIVLITHDLGVVAQNVRRVIVMYAGRKVEEANVDDVFARPLHPYTGGLLNSMPHLATSHARRARLQEIKGTVPSLSRLPPSCAFAARCAYADSICQTQVPPLEQKFPDRWAACWHSDRVAARGAPA